MFRSHREPEPDEFDRNLKKLHQLNMDRRRTPEDVNFPDRVRTVSAWLLTYANGQMHVALCSPEMTANDVRNMGCHHIHGKDFQVMQIDVGEFQVFRAFPPICYSMMDGRRLNRDGFMQGFKEHTW